MDGAVRIISPWDLHWRVDATGLGTRLIPSVFSWPHGGLETGMNGPPSLIYGPRQVVSLPGADPTAADGQPLNDLLGRSRAAILRSVGTPRSTTELARVLH
jgi:hypothetical protein